MIKQLFGSQEAIYNYDVPIDILFSKLSNLQDHSKRLKNDPLVDFEINQNGFKMAANPFENAPIKLSSILTGKLVQQSLDKSQVIVSVQARNSMRILSGLFFALVLLRLAFTDSGGSILSLLIGLLPLIIVFLAAKSSSNAVNQRYLNEVHPYLTK
jgi:hypothetical protein